MFLLSSIFATTAVRITEGRATCVKGKMMQQTLHSINDVCEIFNVSTGEIRVNGKGEIHFSSSIPENARQRLRNCVAQ